MDKATTGSSWKLAGFMWVSAKVTPAVACSGAAIPAPSQDQPNDARRPADRAESPSGVRKAAVNAASRRGLKSAGKQLGSAHGRTLTAGGLWQGEAPAAPGKPGKTNRSDAGNRV